AKLDEPTRKAWGESKLEAGFLADHADMRLLTVREGSLALGHRGPRGKCDVTVTAPFVMQMIPVQPDCAVDPRRFFVEANARRKGIEKDIEEPTSVDPAKATRAFGQAAWDVGHSVYSSERAWTMNGDRLVFWRGVLSPIEVARPFKVERNRIHWGSFARDGSGTAETDEGLVFVSAPGTLSKSAGVELSRLSGPNRSDVALAGRRAAARIGGSTFQARGELRKLAPELAPKAMRALPADTSLVVGGTERGLLLELSPPALAVSSLGADGKLASLTRVKAPVGPGFDAVERAAGGAIVAGPSPGSGSGMVSFVIHANGAVGPVEPLALDPTPFLRMVPMPAGGAIVYDAARTVAVWLDDDGKERARASLPAESARSACLDGRPAPEKVPSLVPGELIDFPSRKTPGTCIVGDIGYRPDGTILWFGSTSSGPHVRADLGVIAAPVKVTPPIGSGSMTGPPPPPDVPAGRCPSDMVLVPPDLCVDRYESTLVDTSTGRFLSSDYPATPNLIASVLGDFATRRERMGDIFARSMPLPHLSSWQRSGGAVAAAHNQLGIRPNGYMTGVQAKASCEAAGKRLCKLDEWKRACRGETDTIFPYGTTYSKPDCNVNRQSHPGAMLHDNASILHLDPRLNRVAEKGAEAMGPMLQTTGANPRCRSRWGEDGIYDMVGNVDEWVDEKGGAFAGGFYGRNTTNGCESVITVHPAGYSDYSTGVRCCRGAD
ncbi:MAG: SUMF1/EgtB/PvdO family nonheme iron enzyme, partial [Myxococcales bacterium]|nr:SUMF1/EgtB/PvdO family nonheme iron enzyme [Myxococcales bacterium]